MINFDALNEYQKRMQQYQQWITIGGSAEGDEKHVGGFPVQIDGDGNVINGSKWAEEAGITSVKPKSEQKKENRTERKENSETQPQPNTEQKPKRTRRPSAKQSMDQSVESVMSMLNSEGMGGSRSDIEAALEDSLIDAKEHFQEREQMKKHVRQMMGINMRTISRIENSGQDYSNVPGFDDMARSVAEHYPELANTGDAEGYNRAVWDLLREGKQKPPSIMDESVQRRAVNALTDRATGFDPAEYEEGLASAPFSRSLWEQQFQAKYGMSTQYAHDESKHPRGPDGKFIKGAGGASDGNDEALPKPKKKFTDKSVPAGGMKIGDTEYKGGMNVSEEDWEKVTDEQKAQLEAHNTKKGFKPEQGLLGALGSMLARKISQGQSATTDFEERSDTDSPEYAAQRRSEIEAAIKKAGVANKDGVLNAYEQVNDKWARNITASVGVEEKHKNAFIHYGSGNYMEINEAYINKAKNGTDGSEIAPEIRETVEAVEDLIDKAGPLKEPIVTWRGIKDDYARQLWKQCVEGGEGAEFEMNNAIVSSSISPAVAYEFSGKSKKRHPVIMETINKTGVYAGQYTGIPGEQEFMQKHKTRYRVVGTQVKQFGGGMVRTIQCEEVYDEEPSESPSVEKNSADESREIEKVPTVEQKPEWTEKYLTSKDAFEWTKPPKTKGSEDGLHSG